MVARVIIASLALLAIASAASPQDAIYVDIADQDNPRNYENLLYPSNYNERISIELETLRSDCLLLYTDYASRAGNDMKLFLKNITDFTENLLQRMDNETGRNAPDECWEKFEYQIKKIEHDARKAAVYSADSHHKFLLGPMIVFKMHLNKSEDYLRRGDKDQCPVSGCPNTVKVRRWRRLAVEEIKRVKEDIQFTRRSYRDLVSHARRKLNHLKKRAIVKTHDALELYKYCLWRQ